MKNSSSAPSKAQVEAAKKRADQQEEELANKLAYALQANESNEDRKKREQKLAEESDIQLAGELLGLQSDKSSKSNSSSVVSGIAGAVLKNKQDHINFANTVAAKLSDSTAFCLSTFFKELTDKIKNDLPLENLNEVISILQNVRDDKKKKEAANISKEKVSSKDIKKIKKKHEDTFGGSYDENNDYDAGYGKLEDDYFF